MALGPFKYPQEENIEKRPDGAKGEKPQYESHRKLSGGDVVKSPSVKKCFHFRFHSLWGLLIEES